MSASPGRFVITVDFELRPGTRDRFLTLVRANAEASVRDEPGCRRFDVLTPFSEADRIALYEIYDDREAFEAHKQMPHFLVFRDAAEPLIARQTVEEWETHENAKS